MQSGKALADLYCRGQYLSLAIAGLLALGGCIAAPTSPRPEQRAPVVQPKPIEPSAENKALASYYASVQQNLLTQGLLRIDGGGPDTPFSKRDIVNNFIKIGVFSEFDFVDGTFQGRGGESVVRRYSEPVRLMLDFAPAITEANRSEITSTTQQYLGRLASVTNHPIRLDQKDPNFLVAILDIDSMKTYVPKLQAFAPGLEASFAKRMLALDRPDHCVVYTFNDPATPAKIYKSVALIRAEHPKLLREKCLHEEIAQGMGLVNDSPRARPSIFNDDDEFAYLTSHDELLLKILYDPRLPLGATPQQARPVVEVIASELLGGES
ncbi:MAG: DUF2927 domain-containing protein [Litoreibacter sp.]|nr:DUF2927 domain-containing protein [Litoreibacter sp.]